MGRLPKILRQTLLEAGIAGEDATTKEQAGSVLGKGKKEVTLRGDAATDEVQRWAGIGKHRTQYKERCLNQGVNCETQLQSEYAKPTPVD